MSGVVVPNHNRCGWHPLYPLLSTSAWLHTNVESLVTAHAVTPLIKWRKLRLSDMACRPVLGKQTQQQTHRGAVLLLCSTQLLRSTAASLRLSLKVVGNYLQSTGSHSLPHSVRLTAIDSITYAANSCILLCTCPRAHKYVSDVDQVTPATTYLMKRMHRQCQQRLPPDGENNS